VPDAIRLRRLALVTDAWPPQVNGVAKTLARLVDDLRTRGTRVMVLAPDSHRTIGLPSYSEIRIACDPWKNIGKLRDFQPDAIHVATEGPIGVFASTWLTSRKMRFTTSFHTRYPEYLTARFGVPVEWGYKAERWFHNRGERTMVGTLSMLKELHQMGVGRNLVHWPRGVDPEVFHPKFRDEALYDLPRPIWLNVGRVAVEKKLEDFLRLDLPGTKVVVGDGPSRVQLEKKYPDVVWRGYRFGEDLAAHYASADCFVFPSRTETFGNVLLESLAAGTPIGSVPAPGPSDLVEEGKNGAIGEDLRAACLRALNCSRQSARESALPYTVRACHDMFVSNLVPVHDGFAPLLPRRFECTETHAA
jgi:glycosyltransferase involved in cell wall biosynthesis